jgi:hypothetical protein
VLPLSEHGEMVATTYGLLSLESIPFMQQTVDDLHRTAERLLGSYPNLLTFSPGITTGQLEKGLALALCTTWEDGGKELEREVSRAHTRDRCATRGELWQVRWATHEGMPPGVWVSPEGAQPVLVERLYMDEAPVEAHADQLYLLVSLSLVATDDEVRRAIDSMRKKGLQILRDQGRPERQRQKPGAAKDYEWMVRAHEKWRRAGRPDELGRVAGVDNNTDKQRLRDAIEWLKHQSEGEDRTLPAG